MDEVASQDLLNSLHEIRPTYTQTGFKRLLLLTSYLSLVPIFIVFLIIFSLYVKYDNNGYVSRQQHKPQFQALPTQNRPSEISVETSDARINALETYFTEYNSPLMGHAQTIVTTADKFGIDYRLLPAIAMQESTLCKKIIKNSYNCWGFGIYGGKVKRFDSFDHAITVITETLAKKYVQKGYVSPEEIVQKYTPGDTGKWPKVVNMMMQKVTNNL